MVIRAKVLEEFTLGAFEELSNIVRNDANKNEKGRLYVGDVFECKKEMADYLKGKNRLGRAFIQIVETIPDKENNDIEKPVKRRRTATKKTSIVKK